MHRALPGAPARAALLGAHRALPHLCAPSRTTYRQCSPIPFCDSDCPSLAAAHDQMLRCSSRPLAGQLPSPHLRELEAEASTVAQVDRWIRSKQLGLFEHLDRTLACLHPLQQTGSERTSVFDASDGPAYSSTSLLSGSLRISSSSVAQTTTLQRPTTIINVRIHVL